MDEYKIAYSKGFKDGALSSTRADFKIQLVQVLSNTKGIGDKTIDKILETFKNMEINNG